MEDQHQKPAAVIHNACPNTVGRCENYAFGCGARHVHWAFGSSHMSARSCVCRDVPMASGGRNPAGLCSDAFPGSLRFLGGRGRGVEEWGYSAACLPFSKGMGASFPKQHCPGRDTAGQ